MIPNLEEFAPGLFRGGQPESDADWQHLKDLGVTDIIKLNLTDSMQPDEGAVRVGLSVFYDPISLIKQIVTEPDLQAIRDAIGFIKPGTFVHCEHGQDRTGLVVGLYRVWVEKKTPEEAHAEMIARGFHASLPGLDKAWADLKSNPNTP